MLCMHWLDALHALTRSFAYMYAEHQVNSYMVGQKKGGALRAPTSLGLMMYELIRCSAYIVNSCVNYRIYVMFGKDYAKLLVNACRASRQCMQSLGKRRKIRYVLSIGLRKLSIRLGKLREMQNCLSIGFRKPNISLRKLCKMRVVLSIGSRKPNISLRKLRKMRVFLSIGIGKLNISLRKQIKYYIF